MYGKEQIDRLFPEYYLIRINNFNDVATNSLDEWIYFLKNEEIKDNFKAKGIQKAKKAFSVINMSENERLAYDRYQYELSYQASIVESNYGLGRLEGREEGMAKGMEQGEKRKALDVAFKMKQMGMALEEVMAITGLTREEVEMASPPPPNNDQAS